MSSKDGPKLIAMPPFKSWLASNIPAVYDNTMSYYEELCALIAYLEKQVTPAVNANTAGLAELKSYVENYFDNLDVQDEIDNKLDEMAEDGTLGEIIGQYIDDNYVTKDMYATESTAGVVKIGSGLDITEDGVLSRSTSDDYIPISYKSTRYNGAGGYSTVHYAIIENAYKPKLTLANDTVNTVQMAGDNALDNKATLTINAGRFNTETYATRGVIIMDGEIVKQNDSGGTGTSEILYMTSDGTLNSVTDITSADQLISLGAIWAVEGWYPFIKDGTDLTGTRDPSDYQPRSLIGQDSSGRYIVFSAMGRGTENAGFNAVDCVSFCTSVGFTPYFLYNLDGGASVNFIMHGIRMNNLIDNESRKVANFITWASDTPENNGAFEAANSVYHKEIQTKREDIPLIINSLLSSASTSVTLNYPRMYDYGQFVYVNLPFNVSATVAANTKIIQGLPSLPTNFSDIRIVAHKRDSNHAITNLFIQGNAIYVASTDTLASGSWDATFIYPKNAGRAQSATIE